MNLNIEEFKKVVERWGRFKEEWAKLGGCGGVKSGENVGVGGGCAQEDGVEANKGGKDGVVRDGVGGVENLHVMSVVASLLEGMEDLEVLRERVKMSKEEYLTCAFIITHRHHPFLQADDGGGKVIGDEMCGKISCEMKVGGEMGGGKVAGEIDKECGEMGAEGGGEMKKMRKEEEGGLICGAGEVGGNKSIQIPHKNLHILKTDSENSFSTTTTNPNSTHTTAITILCEDMVIESPLGVMKSKMMVLELLKYQGWVQEYEVGGGDDGGDS